MKCVWQAKIQKHSTNACSKETPELFKLCQAVLAKEPENI